MMEALVFTEKPRGERDKRTVRREDPNKDGIGEITSRGVTVNLVDVSVSSGTRGRGRRRRVRDREGERRRGEATINWGGFWGEVGERVKGGGRGDWWRRQRSKSWARQDDDVVQVGNEVVSEVQRRS
jgi:hypothetical protein